jgi:hypothetical protein
LAAETIPPKVGIAKHELVSLAETLPQGLLIAVKEMSCTETRSQAERWGGA